MRPNPVLVIGGSGTLGEQVIPLLLELPSISRVRVLSRGEHRQSEALAHISRKTRRWRDIDWLIGDVRDSERVKYALQGCESVFNFAAVKSVDRAEIDPEEAVKTIIGGALNVIRGAKEEKISRCILTSTDKAVEPHNLYGAAKMTAEKLWILEGNKGSGNTRFSVLRYGNVLSSQGSVIRAWSEQLSHGAKPIITDIHHTRFFILPRDAGSFVFERWMEMTGGEIFIPKMKSTTVGELYGAFLAAQEDIAKQVDASVIGARPGEKFHEALISRAEAELVTDCGEYFIRWPESPNFPIIKKGKGGVSAYTSLEAPGFSGQELNDMIKEVLE